MQVNPYLTFSGQCEAAFKFYEQCLGGKIETLFTHADMPQGEQPAPEWRSKILHATLKVGDKTLMGSDVPPQRYVKPAGFSLSMNFDSAADGERVFKALSENGEVQMPLSKTFWAARFGMLVDQFGIPWMVNCERE